MKKLCIGFLIIILLLTVIGYLTDSGEIESSELPETSYIEEESEITQPTVPMLENSEYWEVVRDEITDMLSIHDLYISHINSAYPCVQFYVEPGKKTDDGTAVASGLSQGEYEELYQSVKEELHVILDKYKLAEPKSLFHACDSVVGIYFNNWFVDEQKVSDRVDSLWCKFRPNGVTISLRAV